MANQNLNTGEYSSADGLPNRNQEIFEREIFRNSSEFRRIIDSDLTPDEDDLSANYYRRCIEDCDLKF